MPNINRVALLGHLGHSAEVKALDSGKTVAKFSVATSEKWKDKDGNDQERTEWTDVVYWGRMAEMIAPLLKKGALVYVEGQKQTRAYQAKDGSEKKAVEVKASLVLECRWKADPEPGVTHESAREEVPF